MSRVCEAQSHKLHSLRKSEEKTQNAFSRKWVLFFREDEAIIVVVVVTMEDSIAIIQYLIKLAVFYQLQ